MMRSKAAVLGFLLLIFVVGSVECLAVERTAYLFGEVEATLSSVELPSDSVPGLPRVFPSVIAVFDWWPTGSTLHSDGRILTINADTDELVAVTPATGETEVLAVLSVDIRRHLGDLFWGIDGGLMCSNPVGTQVGLYRVEIDSGEMDLQAIIDEPVTKVAMHDGRYIGKAGPFTWEIDPQTYEATLLNDCSGFYLSCSGWGVASAGGYLWEGKWVGSMSGDEVDISWRDPQSGQAYGCFLGDLYDPELYVAFEVIEQSIPAPVPVLRPVGMVIVVLVLMVAGALLLRRI